MLMAVNLSDTIIWGWNMLQWHTRSDVDKADLVHINYPVTPAAVQVGCKKQSLYHASLVTLHVPSLLWSKLISRWTSASVNTWVVRESGAILNHIVLHVTNLPSGMISDLKSSTTLVPLSSLASCFFTNLVKTRDIKTNKTKHQPPSHWGLWSTMSRHSKDQFHCLTAMQQHMAREERVLVSSTPPCERINFAPSTMPLL